MFKNNLEKFSTPRRRPPPCDIKGKDILYYHDHECNPTSEEEDKLYKVAKEYKNKFNDQLLKHANKHFELKNTRKSLEKTRKLLIFLIFVIIALLIYNIKFCNK